MEKHEREKLSYMVAAGMFAALTALLTAALHIPVANGYIHCGDAVIFLAAVLLPRPYAAGAAAVGGMLADLIAGYPAYALPTFLIKGLLALAFSCCGGNSFLSLRRIAGLFLCGLISAAGYWVTAVFLYGGWEAQFFATVPGNCVQALASAVVYGAAGTALSKVKSAKQNCL